MKKIIYLMVLSLVVPAAALGQSYEKIADDTIKYVKSGTFGKPSLIKKIEKLAIGQLRVHYKTVTSRSAASGRNAADVTVYLDGDITTGDLQQLTDEFYQVLTAKLAKIGIEAAPFEAVKATEYFADRLRSQEKEKGADFDGKSGHAWVSINAFDGPVLYRWRPMGTPEIVGHGQQKKIAKTAETVGAELAMIDIVVDFASIMLSAQVKQDKGVWFYGDPYFHSSYAIGGLMSIPQSSVLMFDSRNKSELYQNDLPVAERFGFSDKPREDAGRAALQSQKYFSGKTSSFTPLVIPADKALYMTATRRVLNQYAEMLTEKFRQLRSGEKPSDKKAVAQQPQDNTRLDQVNEDARKNRETTAVTTNEMTAAAEQAVREGKFKLATDYYSELIKKNPDSFHYYHSRGSIYLNNLKDYKAAVKDFEHVIKLNPNEPAGHYNRGTAYLFSNDFKKAKKDLDAALALKPDHVESYLNRGITNLNLKAYEAALEDFNRGIQYAPRLPNLYRGRALYYKIKGNPAMAQADELRAAQIERGQ